MAVTEVRLAGLTFNSGPDSDGDEFFIEDVDGWDGTGVELVTVERPISDGAVLVRARRTSWSLTISGCVVAPTRGYLGRARHKLETAMDTIVTADGTFAVDQDDGTWTLTVRLAQRLRTRSAGDLVVTFEADLIAVHAGENSGELMTLSYEVKVVDQGGSIFGTVPGAKVTEVSFELNGIGTATISLPTTDPDAALMIPGREIQIYHDGQIIWWGTIVAPRLTSM